MSPWRWILRRHQADRDLHEEIRSHLAMAASDRIADGEDVHAARLAALKEFGNVALTEEAVRQVWLGRVVEGVADVGRDVRYGMRLLARNPGFTIVAVLSLAIGIGANCAVFSFADALLLRPLTVPRPADVVTVGSTNPFGGSLAGDFLVSSYRDYVDVRDRTQSFDGLIAFTSSTVGFAADAGATPRLSMGMLVSGNFFHVMGVEPELGRDFRAEEDQVPGRDPVVILGHDFWARQFGADGSVLGRVVRLNGIDFTVVGVAPAGFTGLAQYTRFEFYAPLMMWPRLLTDPSSRPFDARDFRHLNIRGRLKRGATISQTQSELTVIAKDLERAYPDTNLNRDLRVRTELQTRIANAPPVAVLLAMLTVLAGAVLFVACANVAGLLTGRAPVRAREIALRLAIGAGHQRVIRQLMTESLLIALIGGVLGVGVGYVAVTLFSQIQIPTDLPIVATFQLDRRALFVSMSVALASAIVFGLTPAIRSARTDLTAVMKATDAVGFGRRRRVGRTVLVGGQVAVSVVLLVVATFVYRGFQQQLGNGPGFSTDHLLMMSVAPTQFGYTEDQAQQFFERLVEQARLVPGVRSATLNRYMPMDGSPPSVSIVPEGFQFPAGKESAVLPTSIVDEHYFDTIGLPILKGRGFRATDAADAPKVAIVNDVLAERYWPGQDPLGKRFRLDDSRGPWVEIVGVAKMHKYSFVIERPMEFVYFPYRQRHAESMFLLAASAGDPSSLVTPLLEVVRNLDRNLPISNVRTLDELYRMRSVVVLNVIVETVGAMGMMGLALSVIGLYGLVAYSASRRTKEIGIRMAIGAERSDVLRLVLRQGLMLALTGLGLGLLVSMGAPRALAGIFPGGPAGDGRIDLVAFPLVASAVLTVTLLAAYVPARRASRLNPTDALRQE